MKYLKKDASLVSFITYIANYESILIPETYRKKHSIFYWTGWEG